MRHLHWKLKNDQTDRETLEESMNAYRKVLYEWNDNLNRNLALTQAYFGKGIRRYLEGTVYEEFRRIGSLLENLYIERKTEAKSSKPVSLGQELTRLSLHIYKLNLRMISLIQNQTVGIFNPDVKLSQENKAKPLSTEGKDSSPLEAA